MDATFTRISDVANQHTAVDWSAGPTRNGVVVEITRFDSFATPPTAMASICTACVGESAA